MNQVRTLRQKSVGSRNPTLSEPQNLRGKRETGGNRQTRPPRGKSKKNATQFFLSTDATEVTRFGEWLNATYGISVVSHRGKIHDYLGMILDYSCEGKVIINMAEYINSIVADFPEEITGFRATPAADHLFDVRDPSEARPLPEEQARAFHHAVAQLLFLSARARRDIQPATAFLTTRVTAPDEDDWGKVKRLLQYLRCTVHMPLILSADSLTLARWWVDAAYAVHADCKAHGCRHEPWPGHGHELLVEAENKH